MNKIAILCNNNSSMNTSRPELITALQNNGERLYIGAIFDGEINSFYNEKSVEFLPIIASRSNTNPFIEIKSMYSVMKAIKSKRIDSAIIYGVKNHSAMAIGARLGGAKNILCVVNGSGNLFRIGGFKGGLLRFISFPMLRLAYKCSKAICFQNADDKALFIKKRLVKDDEKSFVTGGSGINLSVYSLDKLPEENRFLFLSRITKTKGIDEYIKAARIVKSKYPSAVFDIVGPLDKSVEQTSESTLDKAIEDGTVLYHGATSDVPSWMHKCRFFIYPSYYPEGVPRCAIQAIACGRPIITCDTPGCKETVVDSLNGFKIAPMDEVQLAEKMIWMIEHHEKVEQMGIESRKIAEHKFDVNEINKILINKLK